MYPDDPKIAFAMLRHNHYVAGRLALFSGELQPAAMLLGYALEFSIKAAAAGVPAKSLSRELQKQLRRHDLPLLLKECVRTGILPPLNVSDEFWEFASDHLNQRYPSQQREVHEQQRAMGRCAVIAIGDIEYYDDAMMQLDDALAAQTGHAVSIVARAAADPDSYSSRTFFHCNRPALYRLSQGISCTQSPSNLWKFGALPGVLTTPYSPGPNSNPAASFKYPVPIATEENGKLKHVVPIVNLGNPVGTNSTHPISIGEIVFGPDSYLPPADQAGGDP